MAGNVLEWTSSYYTTEYIRPFDNNRTRIIYDGSEIQKQVTLRGGSYTYAAHNLRSANRIRSSPNVEDENNGFRCMRPFSFF